MESCGSRTLPKFRLFFSVLQKLRCKRVKIRVLSAVPQMRVFDFYNRLSVGRIDALFAHGLFIRVRHDKTNGAVLRICDLAVILTAADKPVTFGVIIIPDEP